MIRKGFVFPDGTELVPNGLSTLHEDIAMDFIIRNLRKQYQNNSITNPIDFLIACGAMQVSCNGRKVIIVSLFNKNAYINKQIKEYEDNGYKVIRTIEKIICFPMISKETFNEFGYGNTVICVDGVYMYNPNRIGD